MEARTRAARLVGYKAASDVVGKAAVLGVLVVAAHRLPTVEFGLLALATTLGWIVSVASDFGFQLHLGRAITRASHPGRVLWPLFRIRLVSACLGILALGAGTAWLSPARTTLAFLVVAIAPLLSSVSEFLNYAYRGVDRSDLESSLNLGQRLGALALVVAGLAASPSLMVVGGALVLSAAATLATSLVIARRVIGLGLETQAELHSKDETDFDPRLTLESWSRDVAPIGLGLVLSALYFRIDVFLIEQWTGVEAVAHYAAVFRLVDALRLLPAAVITVVLPRLFGARDATFARTLSIGLTGFALLVTGLSLALSAQIVQLTYGPAYAPAADLLRVLLLSFPLLTLNYALTHQLIGWDRQRDYALCCALALVANLALNSWLIPDMGAMGAAWATLGTEVVLTLTCGVALYRASTPG